MSRRILGHAQYQPSDETRPTGSGGIASPDPKRPGGSTAGVHREGSHSFNNKPATKRWPLGRS